MPTTISNLPRDLLEEIISRVPLKLMKTVKLTCKSWNSLSNSESFTKLHTGKVKEREGEMMIAMISQNLYLTSNIFVDQSIEIKGKLVLPNKMFITRVIHYEGFMLCILEDVTRVVVWNPFLGQTRSIHLRHYHRDQKFNYALGYADKESRRSVKFLRFCGFFYAERQFHWYEMYDFDSGLWKRLDVIPHWSIHSSCKSVSFKGNAYWCAKKRSSRGYEDHIICFDFTRERFGPLLPLPNSTYRHVSLSCVKEEKLAALFQHHSMYGCEIWITTKIEAEMVSWSKFLKIDTGSKMYLLASYFIDEEKKVFMALDRGYHKKFVTIIGESGSKRRELDIGVPEQNYLSQMWSYVPSLAQIKKPSQGKRKRQSKA